MNYDRPRQLAEGEHAGKWHYTTGNRRSGVYPIGYCAEHAPHDSEAEARECYGQYQRDRIELRENACSWAPCQIKDCDNPARNVAQSGGWHTAALCNDHFTKADAVAALHLDGPAGDSMHS